MIDEKIKSLLIIDPFAESKGHLLDDDFFWIKGFYRKCDRLKLISSEKSISRIREYFPDVKAKSFIFFSEYFKFCHHLKYILRVISINTAGFDKVLFQSFHEISSLIFSLLHPKVDIYLIVTNNLSGRGKLSSRKILLFIQRLLFSRVSGIIVHTRYEKELLPRLYPRVSEEKIFTKPFHKISQPHRILELNERENRISFFGRMSEERGLDDFLRMASLDKTRKYTYSVYGNTSFSNKQEKLFNSIKAPIEVNRGYFSDEEYYRFIRESMYVVLPYKKSLEGRISGILCDAIACGTPVIASMIEPHIEFFEKYGPMGYLLGSSNLEEWKRILNNNSMVNSWEKFQKALSLARSEHCDEDVISCMLNILKNK